jgi:hypothetical protein
MSKGQKTLAKEISLIWDQKVPKKVRGAIWPLVLDSVSLCLSKYLGAEVYDAIQQVVSEKDLAKLLDLRKQWSSPQKYGDTRSYLAASTVLNLFAKTELPIRGIDPLAKGVERFYEAERLCRITNRRLLHYRNFDHSGRPVFNRLSVHEVFHLARRKIQDWLGPVGELMSTIGARHGPGGVVGLKRPFTTPYFKFAKDGYTVTQGAYWYAVKAIASSDAWIRALAISEGLIGLEHSVSCIPYETRLRLADKSVTIAASNEVTFVNKDATTKRSISVEAEMNVFLQLGVGDHLKMVLNHVGCNLRDQTHNQSLAQVGSMQHGSKDPVTLDLRMASDTLAIELVRELLPSDWFELLNVLRSPRGSYLGKSWEWAKFSSMGNGFTFELESLIFLALSQACSDHNGTSEWFRDTFGPAYKYAYVSVYGDDIIVPACDSALLTAILRYSGFQLNLDKSFVSGPFRESCGKDFWNGVDVRPFYFKRDLASVRDLIHLHNGLKMVAEKFEPGDLDDSLRLVRSLIPSIVEIHLRGVEPTFGDEYIWVTPDEAHRSKLVAWHVHWQQWQFPAARLKPNARNGSVHWRYVQFLYSNTDHYRNEAEPKALAKNRSVRELSVGLRPNGIDAFVDHIREGGSRGDVVESGRGTPSVSWW